MIILTFLNVTWNNQGIALWTYFKEYSFSFTEKMDNLTKQLFDDVQKEERQRMYEISFVLKPLLFSLSALFCFASQLAGSRSQIQESRVWIFLGSERLSFERAKCPVCTSQTLHRFWSCGHSGPLLPRQWEVQRLPPLHLPSSPRMKISAS